MQEEHRLLLPVVRGWNVLVEAAVNRRQEMRGMADDAVRRMRDPELFEELTRTAGAKGIAVLERMSLGEPLAR